MKPRILLVFRSRLEDEAQAIRGIARHARLHHSWVFHLDGEDGRRDADLAWFQSQKWGGVISGRASPALARTCARLKIPLVDLGDGAAAGKGAGVVKICPDDAAAGRLGAEHVLGRGFGALGFVGFADERRAREQCGGFCGAARRAGKRCAVMEIERPREMTPAWEARQVVAISQWLRKQPRPVAVMGCCDELAALALLAAKLTGSHVPEEVAVLGAGNDALRCELCAPSLSSVDCDWFRAGWLAAEALAASMENGGAGKGGAVRVPPGGVVERQSTRSRAVGDVVVAAALNFIREQACRGLTVDEVLKRVSVSRSVLEKKFRAHRGRSPQTEIRRAQVDRISELLRETDFPLKKIAALTGFGRVEYLCVVYKRLTGAAPGAYRKKCKRDSKAGCD